MPMRTEFEQKILPLLEYLVERYSTPFHIYDEAGIKDAHNDLVTAFAGLPFKQYFAVKALPNPYILGALLELDSGFDCSSIPEIKLATSAGAAGDSIFFTSNNTTRQEFAFAIQTGATINVDDLCAFQKLPANPEVISFRVALNLGDDVHIGSKDQSKFGIPEHLLGQAYQEARQRGIRRFGIHAMAASNELEVTKAVAGARKLFALASRLGAEQKINFEFINIGGGIGIPYRPEQTPFDLKSYSNAVAKLRMDCFGDCLQPPAIFMECGRYITGPHGILVTRVINRMQKSKCYIGVDASMSALMRPGLYSGAYHHITLPFAGWRRPEKVDVVGSLCENFDKFAVDRILPSPRDDDILLVHDTGAHGHAMGFNYNGRLRPAELMFSSQGEILEIRRAENFEDYVATITGREVLQPHHRGSLP